MSRATGIVATLLEGDDKHERAHEIPGAFFYYVAAGDQATERGIIYSCPCGCRQLGALNLDPSEGKRPLWRNSGTRELPTLSPSVGIRPLAAEQDTEADGFHWHGWLRDGVWVSC